MGEQSGRRPARGTQRLGEQPGGPLSKQARASLKPEQFRLRYALAAACAHEALVTLRTPKGHPRISPPAELEWTGNRATALFLRAVEITDGVIKDAEDEIQKADPERILSSVARFLEDALIPAARILRSGVQLELNHLGAPVGLKGGDQEIDPDVSALVQRKALNYRVRYNLACLFASRAVHSVDGGGSPTRPSDRPTMADEERLAALQSLEAALAECPPAVRGRLARWAAKDPSLEGLRAGTWRFRLDQLLERYSSSQSPPADGLLAELNAVGSMGAAHLRKVGIVRPSDLSSVPEPIDAEWLHRALDVPPWWAERWLAAALLASLEPLSPDDVNALQAAGIADLRALAFADALQLVADLGALGRSAPPGWSPPPLERLDHWINAAERRLNG